MSELQTTVPASRQEEGNCPDCGGKMEDGVFDTGQTFAGWGFAGTALPHLFFQRWNAGRKARKSVLSWADSPKRIGWCCPACGFSMIRGEVASKAEHELRERRRLAALPPRNEWWRKYY